ncbi:hypothetical protein QR680_015214 [Steinernema hermaphroditum]|uniref:Aladin seven-bladed propeller domain-containing protein n=1 Tax=Steinernema hermaphroditum TaxID=289476 RepID=A0AA39IBK2_9BILA|nr:hypothetical protein QR680_015214 [Steinernema hermaphroditum]
MSLLNFPPPRECLDECYAVQDVNGRLSYGSKDDVNEFMRVNLKRYPLFDKAKLQQMQHSMSHGNLENAFRQSNSSIDKVSKIARIWNRKGASGLVGYMVGGNENKLGKLVRSVSFGFIAPMEDIEQAAEEDSIYEECSSTLNWKENWVRAVAWHPSGNRVAVCQPSDYIRVFKFGDIGAPKTLQHVRQKRVSAMCWQLFDQHESILAVGCSDCVIVWRLPAQMTTNRPPPSCAQVIENSAFSPVTDLFWDEGSLTSLYICSAGSSRIQICDILNDEHASVSCGERVGRMFPSKTGSKLMVALMNNSIKVFDKIDWTYERWSDLTGRCTSAVWTADEQYLLFTTLNEKFIYYIRFNHRGNTSRTFGNSYASVIYDLSEILLTDPDRDTSDKSIGGSVKSLAINNDGNRLAVSFQDNPKNIALFIVDTNPFLNLIPGSFIEAPEFGIATHISFVPQFTKGALLCTIWSEGKMQYIPLIYGKNQQPFLYTNYASFNCSSIIGGLPGSSAISPEPAGECEGDKENVDLSSRQLLKLSNIEKSLSPTFSSKNTSWINLFSQSGLLHEASFHSILE